MLRTFIIAVQWGFLGYFILLNIIYLGLAFIALYGLRRYMGGISATERVLSHLQMPVSLVVPAYNEEATITTSVRALLQLRYQHFEVVVVNDGSKDATLADADPRLRADAVSGSLSRAGQDPAGASACTAR